MPPIRERQDEEHAGLGQAHHALLRAETLRSAEASAHLKAARAGEERVSMFWRLFGGTLLSITALVIITVYQQFTGTLSELRTNLNHLTESRGEMVKSDEFNTRTTSLWNSIKELQTANVAISTLKERSTMLEQQVKAAQDQVSSRMAGTAAMQKELDSTHAALLALKERSTLLEQQVKTADEERKELVKEVQQLRERQAVLEGRQTAAATAPPTTPPANK